MLQEATDDALDHDVLAHTRQAAPQAADAAHDQVDFHAGRRCAVERKDRIGIDQRVHLRDDASWAALARMLRLAINQFHEAAAHVRRRHQQLAVQLLATESRQCVEQVAHIGADARAAREQSEVGVELRRPRVIVAGTDVHVPADAIGLAAHDECRLGVRLQPRHAVHHMHAVILQRASPRDVVRLVETRLQLDQHDHLLAPFRRLDQRAHDRRFARCAVQRELDRQHLFVGRRTLDEMLDRLPKAFERMMHEHVVLANRVEDVCHIRQFSRDAGHKRWILEIGQVDG